MIALDKLELIRVVLPAIDMVPHLQTTNFFSFFSAMGFESFTCSLLKELPSICSNLEIEYINHLYAFIFYQDHFTFSKVNLKGQTSIHIDKGAISCS
jgi:hypothetical protein